MSKMGKTKQQILDSLKQKSKTLTDLSMELDLAPSTVAGHIQDLLAMNAIKEIDESNRKWKYYEVNPEFNAQPYSQGFIERFGLVLGLVIAASLIAAGITAFVIQRPSAACLPVQGVTCGNLKVQASSGQLSLEIGGFSNPISVTGIGCGFNNTPPTVFTPLSVYVPAGQTGQFNLTCSQLPQIAKPGLQRLGIWLSYTFNGTESVRQVANITLNIPALSTTTQSTTSTVAATTSAPTISAAPTIAPTIVPTASTTVPMVSTTTTQSTQLTACGSLVVLYIGQNVTCGSFAVELADLAQPNANAISPAVINVYFAGALTNTTQVTPPQNATFTVSGITMHVYVNATFYGLYSTQRWAKLSLSVPGVKSSSSTTTGSSSTTTRPTTTVTQQPQQQQECNTLVPLYFGENATCGPFTAELDTFADVGGQYQAEISVYVGGTVTNDSLIAPAQTKTFTVGGNVLSIYVNQTVVDGNLSNQRWAKLSLNVTAAPPPSNLYVCNGLVTLHLGYNDTCSPFEVQLADLTTPNSSGVSAAVVGVFQNGVQTNESSIYPKQTGVFDVNGNVLKVYVNKTVPALIVTQRTAQLSLNVTLGPPQPPASGCVSQNAMSYTFYTIYVGQNDTCGPIKVQLYDLSQPNASGESAAMLYVYYKGTLTNVTQLSPGSSGQYYTNGNLIDVNINRTFAGLYPTQRWAQIALNVTIIPPPPPPPANGCSAAGHPSYFTIYVGQNTSCSPFKVVLLDLGQPNSSGDSPAVLGFYYGGTLTNETDVYPGHYTLAEQDGNVINASVQSTFAGIYSWQRWAKLALNTT